MQKCDHRVVITSVIDGVITPLSWNHAHDQDGVALWSHDHALDLGRGHLGGLAPNALRL